MSTDIVEHAERPDHPRVHYLLGSSTSAEIVEQVKSFIREGDTVMVALDSDHRRDHVLAELRIYIQRRRHGRVVPDRRRHALQRQPDPA